MTSSPESTADGPRPVVPGFADVEAAARRLEGRAIVTPLLESPALNARVGGRVLLKAETLQRTGSFKFRGAYNRISRIPEAERAAGVIAYSSGNHAQGVAAAAALLGVPATIVMPADAPAIKLDHTRGYGAEVVLYDRQGEAREELALHIARRSGATMVRPYDDPAIIAGQGTCGLELARQAALAEAKLEALLVCCGGGGLSAGCALALSELSPDTEIYAVEPEGFDDTGRSLALGERVGNDPAAQSFCDALLAPKPGELTFEVNRRWLAGGLAVSDAEVAAAMAYAFRTLKLVVEPGGAVSLAAILAGRYDAGGKTVALTLSGANVDPDTYRKVLAPDGLAGA
ncbi:MAG: threonine/serine dehydratase [Kiloniellaceae bacterium]